MANMSLNTGTTTIPTVPIGAVQTASGQMVNPGQFAPGQIPGQQPLIPGLNSQTPMMGTAGGGGNSCLTDAGIY